MEIFLIRFDISWSHKDFPPGCEKFSLDTEGINYIDVNEKCFPIKYLMRSIYVYKKWEGKYDEKK